METSAGSGHRARVDIAPIVALVLLVVFSIGNYVLGFEQWTIHWWSNIAWTLASGAAAVMCFITARTVGEQLRKAWLLFGGGCLAWFIGILIWSYLELAVGELTPFPALSDVGFLALPPLFMAGLIYYGYSAPSRALTLKHISNLGFTLSSLAIITIAILVAPIQSIDENPLYIGTAIALSVLYLGLFLFALYLFFHRRWGQIRGVMALLLSGIGVHAITNTIYAHELIGRNYLAGHYLDVYWLIGFALIFLAARKQATICKAVTERAGESGEIEERSTIVEALLPGIALILVIVVLFLFSDLISGPTLAYLFPAGVGLLLFLLMWEWSRYRLERRLYDRVVSSEDRIRSSEQRFRNLVETTDSVIVYLSTDGAVLEFNPAAEQLYKMKREQVVGKDYFELFLPEHVRDAVDADMRKVLAGTPTRGFENEILADDGSIRVLTWNVNRTLDSAGMPSGIVAVGHDITERKRADESLRESRRMLQLVLDSIPVRVFWKDRNLVYMGCNDLFARDAGLESPKEIIGRNDLEMVWREQAELYRADDAEVMTSGMAKFNYEEPQTVPGGKKTWLRTSKVPLTDSHNTIIGILGTYEDITESKKMERQAAERNLRLRRLSELSLTLSGDPAEVFQKIAQMLSELLEVRIAGVSELRDDELFVASLFLDGKVVNDIHSYHLSGTPCARVVESKDIQIFQNVAEIFPDDEFLRECNASSYCGFPALDSNENVIAVTCLLDDKPHEFNDEDLDLLRIIGQRVGSEIERRRHLEVQASAAAQMLKLSSAVEQTADIVLITDRNGTVEYVNPAFEQVTGYSFDEVRSKGSGIVRSGKHDQPFYKKLWKTILDGRVFQDVMINRKKNGDIYYEEKTITPLKDARGEVTHFISTGKDITERMQIQERLYHLAYHDILTELPNRALFVDRLDHALARQRDMTNTCMAVLFMDLDRFKNINDTLGHDVGDRMLQALSERLLASLRESDTVARLAGDEFVILLEDIDTADDVAPICRKILDGLSRPFLVDANELFVTASIGISLYPLDGKNASTLLRNADIAMYRAKELGRNTYQFYAEDMSAKAFERLSMETSLRHALNRDEFLLYYQPQISLKTGKIIGVEALLRWNHPDFGLVQPSEFIPLLEETGLIVPVGDWVLQVALKQAKEWQRSGHEPVRVAVNLSSRQFSGTRLKNVILDLVDETGLSTEWIGLEITESLLMNNERLTLEMLQTLSATGIRLSVDDFGTGYSSLSYLKRFPIDTLKIDSSFIRDVTSDPDDAAIVQAIIAMATTLKIDVIAEGVETREQLQFLRDQKCVCLQGFLFSKPLPVDEMTDMLRRDNAGLLWNNMDF